MDDDHSLDYIEDPYFNPQTSTETPSLDDLDCCSDYDVVENELELFDLRQLDFDDTHTSLDESVNVEAEFFNVKRANAIIRAFFKKDFKRQVRVTYCDLTKPYLAKLPKENNFRKYLDISTDVSLCYRQIKWCRMFARKFSSIDSSEVKHFKKFSDDWWNESGEMRPLHALNKLRIPFIRDGIISTSPLETSTRPLEKVSIVDVGCGGGILSEPLARLGAHVTGIDASPSLIEKAKVRAEKIQNLSYICGSIEEYARENKDKFDAVVASEVMEHVTKKDTFLDACSACLKPGGSIFITTMNKTLAADFIGVFLAENVLKLLPKGTHQYDKFIKPHNLEKMLEDRHFRTLHVQGMAYNFLSNNWSWCSNDAINYALHAVKIK